MSPWVSLGSVDPSIKPGWWYSFEEGLEGTHKVLDLQGWRLGAGHQPGGERQVSSGRWWLHATVFLMSAWLQFLILGSMFTCQSHTLFSMTPVNFWHGCTQDLFLQLARWLTHNGCSANTGWANVSQGDEGQCAYSQVGRDHACGQVSSFFISASGVSECVLHGIGGSAAMPYITPESVFVSHCVAQVTAYQEQVPREVPPFSHLCWVLSA